MLEIKFFARGGQGALWAAEAFVRAAIAEGKYATCLPMYTIERPGIPLFVDLRFDDKPIREKCLILSPGCVVLFDRSIPRLMNPFSNIQPGALLVVNDSHSPDAIPRPEGITRLSTVDATNIGKQVIGEDVPAAALLGGITASCGLLPADTVEAAIDERLQENDQLRSQREAHCRAFWQGLETTKIINLIG